MGRVKGAGDGDAVVDVAVGVSNLWLVDGKLPEAVDDVLVRVDAL
eukprot:CAMPEP_0184362752 /NCGR_PEP_ID=MMETSP1089-20130417/136372_1 /TAXON_ID=38269 ORGANISM="Gloeochaete wittrockiana, Strain SAG46.84" /NCGR_SAMPLE_ID=MMETSP1089 /ASSEMBLY_ACC=CAM_ASM_000445 /LENGTH=44 /DNA_ID= /DNA_START= /DNA_END= /DNA_ORIENTATION=